MTDKRFKITSEMPEGWVDIIDTDSNQTLCNIRIEYADYMVNLLNELDDDFNDVVSTLFKVQEENRNTKAVLQDFMEILNRLQSDPNDEQTLGVARDMLQNMGVDLK